LSRRKQKCISQYPSVSLNPQEAAARCLVLPSTRVATQQAPAEFRAAATKSSRRHQTNIIFVRQRERHWRCIEKKQNCSREMVESEQGVEPVRQREQTMATQRGMATQPGKTRLTVTNSTRERGEKTRSLSKGEPSSNEEQFWVATMQELIIIAKIENKLADNWRSGSGRRHSGCQEFSGTETGGKKHLSTQYYASGIKLMCKELRKRKKFLASGDFPKTVEACSLTLLYNNSSQHGKI
jgi:hypothetical protein